MGRFIELSHTIVEGMETYRPLPTPRVEVLNDYDASRYEGKSEFLIASLHLGQHRDVCRLAQAPVSKRRGPRRTGARTPCRPGDSRCRRHAYRAGDRARRPTHRRLEREGPAFPHRLLAPLGHRELLQRQPVPERRYGRGACGCGPRLRRHRFAQHRRRRRPVATRAHPSARSRHPDLRAHDQPRRHRVGRWAIACGPHSVGRWRDLSGTRVPRRRPVTVRGPIVIVGGGMAGGNAAKELRKQGYAGELLILAEEPSRPFGRPPLTKGYLRGEEDLSGWLVAPTDWYQKHRIQFVPAMVVGLNPAAKKVKLESGEAIPYERLLL